MANGNKNAGDRDVAVSKRLRNLGHASITIPFMHNFFPTKQEEEELKERSRKHKKPKSCMQGEEDREKRLDLSTTLRLYEDPWKIKKTLTMSDLNSSSRLLVPTNLAQAHILPFFNANYLEGDGVQVKIWDHDIGSEHQLEFKRWPSSTSYVFNGEWSKEFVRRRNLVKGDQIGLFWNPYNSRFHLSVLNRVLPHNNGASSAV